MGLGQAAPLAAAQSGQARPVRLSVRALRYGCGDAGRNHRPGEGQAQHLRRGSQMAVARRFRWTAAGGFPGQARSALEGRAGQARERLSQPRRQSRVTSRRTGRTNSASGPASRFRSAPSTPTGMRSGRASRKATSSMSSAPRPASSPMPASPNSCRGCAAWSKAACTRLSPASKRGCRRSATCSTPSQRAPAPPWRRCRTGSTGTAPARPACCGFRGTMATAPSWSTPTLAGSRSAGTWSTPRKTSCSRRSKAPPFTPASSSTG